MAPKFKFILCISLILFRFVDKPLLWCRFNLISNYSVLHSQTVPFFFFFGRIFKMPHNSHYLHYLALTNALMVLSWVNIVLHSMHYYFLLHAICHWTKPYIRIWFFENSFPTDVPCLLSNFLFFFFETFGSMSEWMRKRRLVIV